MLIQPTLDTLNRLKLHGMALALSEQMTHGAAQGLAFEERLTLLLEREEFTRDNQRMTRLLQLATLKYRDAVIEDLDYRSRTGLEPDSGDRCRFEHENEAGMNTTEQMPIDPGLLRPVGTGTKGQSRYYRMAAVGCGLRGYGL